MSSAISLLIEPQDHLKSWNIVKKKWGEANEQIIDDIIRVRYPKGSSSPGIKDAPLGGMGFHACPGTIFPAEDVTLSYEVRFADNFQPVKGGKLPGLYISKKGDHEFKGASGGRRVKVNGSVRVMWRKDFAAEAYVYTPSGVTQDHAYTSQSDMVSNGEYGDSLGRKTLKLAPNTWNSVSVRVRMNTPGKADGIVAVTINGKTYSNNNVTWRKSQDVQVSALFFSTFFGGKEDYKTPVDTSAEFRNFHLIDAAMS